MWRGVTTEKKKRNTERKQWSSSCEAEDIDFLFYQPQACVGCNTHTHTTYTHATRPRPHTDDTRSPGKNRNTGATYSLCTRSSRLIIQRFKEEEEEEQYHVCDVQPNKYPQMDYWACISSHRAAEVGEKMFLWLDLEELTLKWSERRRWT